MKKIVTKQSERINYFQLYKQHDKNVEGAGLVPICETKSPSHTFISNNKAVLASQSSIFITTRAISKTNNRCTAGKSLISAMVFLVVVVASTHFMCANEENDEIRKHMKDAPVGVKTLYDMVSKVHGNLPVIPIKTQFVYSSNDPVMYLFEGKRKDNDLFRLVSSKTLKHTRT